MRFKPVPERRDVAFLERAQRAVPLVPGTVDDCCARLVEETEVGARDEARTLLTFLRALELVEETPRGYRRRRVEADPEALGDAFVRRVYGAAELREALREAGSPNADEAFERMRPHVPQWERDRHADWESVWRERVERLLAWSVEFGLAARDGASYLTSEER